MEESKTKDTTKKNKKDKINTKNICVGQVFKNYTEFCEAIGIKPKKSGNSKLLQVAKIEEIIKFKKEGQQIIILSIKEEEETRGTGTIYYKLIEEALIIILHNNNQKGFYNTTKTDLLAELGLINRNFNKCRANINIIAYNLNIPKLVLINFFKANMDRVNATLKYNLDKFLEKNEDFCSLNKELVRLCFNVGKEDKVRYRLATKDEIELINECEDEVLKDLKIDSREDLQYRDKWNIFIRESLRKVKEQEGFKNLKFYYKIYQFEIDEDEFEKLYDKLEEKNLDKIIAKINKQSKKASKESVIDRQKKAAARLLKNTYKKDYEQIRDKLLVEEDVVQQNNLCMNNFIKSTAKEISISEVIKKNKRKYKKESKAEVTTEEVVITIEEVIENTDEVTWEYDITSEDNIPF